ncbi:MAG: tetratricopeptide repeat protein, partial [Kiritimatiellae bacterium]|nr:tetratricopeptide repeat protein [Kiritimatiellia bacterium]
PSGTFDRELKRLYPFVLWRLSRIMRLRAQADAVERRYADSIRATQLSEELDGVNYELAAMRLGSSWLKRSKKGVLTPREGLAIGLARADFILAADYATKVLRANPNDSRAHFAIGMKYLLSEDYLLAEHHLLRCLEGNPGEPAALNNLANAELKLGKIAEAEAHVRQALDRLPENDAIRGTLAQIRKAASKSR